MKNRVNILIIILTFLLIQPYTKAEDYGIIPEENTGSVTDIESPQETEETEDAIVQDSSDDVELDMSKVKTKTISNKVNPDVLNTPKGYNLSAPQQQKQDLYDTDSAYQKKKTSYKKSKKFKKGEVGAKYDTTFTPDSASQTRTLYSNYNLNEKTTINASYSNNSTGSPSEQMKGTVSVSPEYRINKKMSLQNTFSKNMGTGSTKEEVSVKLNPFKDTDRMDIRAGAGQVQYSNGAPSSSQINFGTNIKF